MAKARKGKIKVILADDHPLLRAGFVSALAEYPDIQTIEDTGDIAEACALFTKLKPDVAVLDIMFSGKKTGLDAIKSIIESDPHARVVVLSQFDQDSLIKEAYKCGAMAFVTKAMDIDQLIAAIRKAAQGERYFAPAIAERLADLATRSEPMPLDTLSQRELDVLKLIGEGKTAQDIAQALNISVRTVVNHTQSIKTKLDVERRSDLIGIAQRVGENESWL
jgi:DNA-binding NarL/FixJ family response regulator